MEKKNKFCAGVLRLLPSFILLASLLVLPKAQGAVGDTFTLGSLKYTVLTEEPASQTGTVSVGAAPILADHIEIPASVINGEISYSVTLIQRNAFREFSGLKSITIPDSVTEIGRGAFRECAGLASIHIPDSVTEIGWEAFSGCSNLTEIVVGNENHDYSSLDGVLFNEAQTTLVQCPGGKSGTYTIPDNVISIGYAAFWGCAGLTSIHIPDSVTEIGEGAFLACLRLEKIIIPDSITDIGSGTFNTCTNLTNVIIPDSVTHIGTAAFRYCYSLTNVIVGNRVVGIGTYAFRNCGSLTGVYFRGNAPYVGDDGVFYEPSVIYYSPGTTGWTDPWPTRPPAHARPTFPWIAAPEIIEQPQGRAVKEGSAVTLSVVAAGPGLLSYQWHKEGAPLVGATGARYTIESVSAGDLGNYTVVVSNEVGEATSTVATLTLKVPHRATATVQVVNGFVVGLTVTDGSWGYTRTPNIKIIDETGTGATGHCVIENGVVTQIIVDNPGSGYSAGATVLIGSPLSNTGLKIAVSEVKVKMSLVLGIKYRLWSSVDCIDWIPVGEPFIAEESEVDIRFEVEDYGRFFKLQEI